jgi:hypothetical protein
MMREDTRPHTVPQRKNPERWKKHLLFLRPRQTRADQFDATALRAVVAVLHEQIYGNGPRDPLFEPTLTPDGRPNCSVSMSFSRVRSWVGSQRGEHGPRCGCQERVC